jgi:hypothetical protein
LRAKAAAKLGPPVAKVDDVRILRRLQIFGRQRERPEERVHIPHEVGAAIEVHQQPLVRVEEEAVGVLDAVEDRAHFGEDRGGSGPRGVHVKPHLLAPAELADRAQRIQCRRRSRAHRRDDAGGPQPGGTIFCDRRREPLRLHRECGIRLDEPERPLAIPRQPHALCHRRMRLL